MAVDNKLAVQSPAFWDEEALLHEERRMFDVCHGCRLCWNFCPVFPAVFEKTDAVEGDLSKLSRQEFRIVEDTCYQCKLCYIRCPYTAPHQYDMDIPRLLMRAKFVNTRKEGVKLQDKLLGNTDRLGQMGGLTAPLANWGNRSKPVRFVMEKALDIHRSAILPAFHPQSFSAWFKKHQDEFSAAVPSNSPTVALFYTCFVNYNDPSVGIACAQVLAHNNIRVMVPEQRCCGMPFLDGGDLNATLKKIKANLQTLAEAVRQGCDIVVPGPTCSYTLKQEYPRLMPTEESQLVSQHTFDISEYLWKLRGRATLNTQFTQKLGKVAYHLPCHTRAQFMGNKGADLLALVPETTIELVERCSAHDGTWGVKKQSHPISLQYGEKLFQGLKESEADLYVTDCPLAALQIQHGTGSRPVHTMQALKVAYGI